MEVITQCVNIRDFDRHDPILIQGQVRCGPLVTAHAFFNIPILSPPTMSVIDGLFDPENEYGRGCQCSGVDDMTIFDFLHQDARSVLPKGFPYELRLELGWWEFGRDKYESIWIDGPPRVIWLSICRRAWGKVYSQVNPDSWTEIQEAGCYIRGRFFV